MAHPVTCTPTILTGWKVDPFMVFRRGSLEICQTGFDCWVELLSSNHRHCVRTDLCSVLPGDALHHLGSLPARTLPPDALPTSLRDLGLRSTKTRSPTHTFYYSNRELEGKQHINSYLCLPHCALHAAGASSLKFCPQHQGWCLNSPELWLWK